MPDARTGNLYPYINTHTNIGIHTCIHIRTELHTHIHTGFFRLITIQTDIINNNNNLHGAVTTNK